MTMIMITIQYFIMWIARDDYGLWLFVNKPTKAIFNGDKYFIKRDNIRYSIDSNLFPEITFENSPREVEFKFSATGADRGRRDSIIRGLKRLEEDYMLSYEEEVEWLNKLVK